MSAVRRSQPIDHAVTDPSPLEVLALRFLLRTGRMGEGISKGMAERVGDRDLIGNLTVILVADLFLDGGRRPVEIQALTGLTSGGVTKLLDRMEAAGLTNRSHGEVPGDRRAIEVHLTEKGKEFARLLAAGLVDKLDDTRATLRELADEADLLADAASRGS